MCTSNNKHRARRSILTLSPISRRAKWCTVFWLDVFFGNRWKENVEINYFYHLSVRPNEIEKEGDSGRTCTHTHAHRILDIRSHTPHSIIRNNANVSQCSFKLRPPPCSFHFSPLARVVSIDRATRCTPTDTVCLSYAKIGNVHSRASWNRWFTAIGKTSQTSKKCNASMILN